MIASHIPAVDHSGKTTGKNRKIDRNQPAKSPARALTDVGIRVFEEIGRARRKSPHSQKLSKMIWSSVISHLGRLVKRVVSIAVLLAVAYFLIQNYGSPATRRMVNDVISRITALL
jgi:hypothetical protein